MSLCPVFCASVERHPLRDRSKKVAELHPLLNVHDLVGPCTSSVSGVLRGGAAWPVPPPRACEWRGVRRGLVSGRAAQRRQRAQTALCMELQLAALSFCLSAVPVSAASPQGHRFFVQSPRRVSVLLRAF